MNTSTGFSLKRSGYSVKQLTLEDAEVLQRLYEQCTEFALLTDGLAPSPTAAREEFEAVPKGKTTQDKYVFGLFNSHNPFTAMVWLRRCGLSLLREML